MKSINWKPFPVDKNDLGDTIVVWDGEIHQPKIIKVNGNLFIEQTGKTIRVYNRENYHPYSHYSEINPP